MFFFSFHFTKCNLIMTLPSKLFLPLLLDPLYVRIKVMEKISLLGSINVPAHGKSLFVMSYQSLPDGHFLNYPLSFLLTHSKVIFIQSQNLQNLLSNLPWKHSVWNANIAWWTFMDILFKSLLKCHDGHQWICSLSCCQSLMSKEDWPCYFSA